MPKFNRERAKTELGWTDAQIDAYLSSAQARLDSTVTATPGAGGSDPLGMIGGMGAGAMDAIGGPRTLIGGGLLGAGGTMIAKHLMKNRGQAPAAPTAPTPAPAAPATAAPTSYNLSRPVPAKAPSAPNMSRTQPASSPRTTSNPAPAPPKRTTTPKTPKPKRTTKPPDPIPIRTPGTVPIKVQGKPKAVRGAKQRGVSKRELASRQRGMAASRLPAALPETDDMMEQLSRSLHVEQGMRARGVPSSTSIRGPVRAGLRGAGHPALSLLMMLMDAQSMPEQMDEAERMKNEQFLPPELLEQLRRQPRPESL